MQGLFRGLVLAGLAAAVVVGVASSRSAVAPSNTAVPSITGSASVGSTVSANPGTWSGTAPITFTYQWQTCDSKGATCTNISGATTQNYQIKSSDQNNTLKVQVTAKNADGTANATSNASGTIAAAGPTNTAAPTISGTLTTGSTLTAQNGTWTGAQPITFTYQWQSCDANGDACKDITGATTQTYQVATSDEGNTLRAFVIAKNTAGTTSLPSATSTKIGPTGGGGGSTPGTGCGTPAAGATSVPVASVSSPARLQVASFFSTPRVIPGAFGSFQLQVHISDTCGHAVQGAEVYATAVPFNQVSIPPKQMTDSSGNTTLQFNRRNGFPAATKQQLMVLFVRAAKPGDPILAGISTRRLISLRVNLSQST
jgi:hypothetical protein